MTLEMPNQFHSMMLRVHYIFKRGKIAQYITLYGILSSPNFYTTYGICYYNDYLLTLEIAHLAQLCTNSG